MKRLLFFFCFLLVLFTCSCTTMLENNADSPIRWIGEKSHFKDYSLQGNSISFRYSFYMVNESNEDEAISFDVKFNPDEISEWVRSENDDSQYFTSDYAIIKAKSRGAVDVVFEGEYLGGKVNTNLSFPEIILTSEVDPDDT